MRQGLVGKVVLAGVGTHDVLLRRRGGENKTDSLCFLPQFLHSGLEFILKNEQHPLEVKVIKIVK